MKQLAEELGILPLVRKHVDATPSHPDKTPRTKVTSKAPQKNAKENLNKEELRLLVKILKAIGHTCEHRHIRIQDGITRYQFNDTTLIFDDVSKADNQKTMHLSPLSLMLEDPNQKRPTWEKLKALK